MTAASQPNSTPNARLRSQLKSKSTPKETHHLFKVGSDAESGSDTEDTWSTQHTSPADSGPESHPPQPQAQTADCEFSSQCTSSVAASSDDGESGSESPLCKKARTEAQGLPAARRSYREVNRRGSHCQSIELGGRAVFSQKSLTVCESSARTFLGVGKTRVRRVMEGRADGRTIGHRLPNRHAVFAPKKQLCTQFLVHVWQHWGEGLPDKFSMSKRDGCTSTLTLGGKNAATKPSQFEPNYDSDADDVEDWLRLVADSGDEEATERDISGLALHIHTYEQSACDAFHSPANCSVPRRYIGVIRPMTLWLVFLQWCHQFGSAVASFSVFLRTLKTNRFLRFRTMGWCIKSISIDLHRSLSRVVTSCSLRLTTCYKQKKISTSQAKAVASTRTAMTVCASSSC